MPFQSDLTPEEEAEFKAMEVGTPPPPAEAAPPTPPAPAEAPPPAPAEAPPVVEGAEEALAAPKPGEPGSKHRADGTFKTKEELEADATAIAEAEAKAPKPQKMVPHQALHEAREREKSALQKAQLLETRMNRILSANAQRAPTPAEAPDLTTNPLAYIENLDRRLAAFEAERQENEQYSQIDQAFSREEDTFRQLQPDYDKAGEHYLRSRYAELSQFYPTEQIQKMLVNEVRQIDVQSWDRGVPAAQTVYALAQARGYAPAQLGEPTPPTPPAPPAPTAADIVASAAAGQTNSRSLSGGAGGAATQLNAEAIANMNDYEFDEYLKAGTKGADARFAALFGG